MIKQQWTVVAEWCKYLHGALKHFDTRAIYYQRFFICSINIFHLGSPWNSSQDSSDHGRSWSVQVWESIRIKILGPGHSQRNITQTGGGEQVPHYLAHTPMYWTVCKGMLILWLPCLPSNDPCSNSSIWSVFCFDCFDATCFFNLLPTFSPGLSEVSKDPTDIKNVVTCAKPWHLLMMKLMLTNPLCYTRTGAEMRSIDPSNFAASSHRLVTHGRFWEQQPTTMWEFLFFWCCDV